jgi:hypothetical protein
MLALRELQCFRPSSKLKAPKLQSGVLLGGQGRRQPGLHLIRSWASRAMHYQCTQSWARTLVWQGFPRGRTKNYLGYLFPMGHHENRIGHAGRGLVDGCTLGHRTAMPGRLLMLGRVLVTCVVTCGTKTKGLHRCKPLFCMVPAPDERYVLGTPGFPGIWISVEKSAYLN